MKIIAYKTSPEAMELLPSKPTRDWMDQAIQKNPNRCLPLLIANSYGWSLISSSEFVAEWNGGQRKEDIKIEHISGSACAMSHFGEGVLSWHTGYVFQTEFPYGMYVTGSPNEIFENIVCLSGIVETYWLPFSFLMNWKFTAPGRTRVKQGDVIAHVFPIRLDIFEDVEPEIKSIDENPEFKKKYLEWCQHRRQFFEKPRDNNEWQKNYFKGVDLEGKKVDQHYTNINVCPFKNPDESAPPFKKSDELAPPFKKSDKLAPPFKKSDELARLEATFHLSRGGPDLPNNSSNQEPIVQNTDTNPEQR